MTSICPEGRKYANSLSSLDLEHIFLPQWVSVQMPGTSSWQPVYIRVRVVALHRVGHSIRDLVEEFRPDGIGLALKGDGLGDTAG